MKLVINTKGILSLEQHQDFKHFSIDDRSQPENRTALEAIAEAAEDNHYWVDAEAIVALSPQKGDPQWEMLFWKMLAAVEPYGYANLETKKVKAHIDAS